MRVLYNPITIRPYQDLPLNVYKGDYLTDALFHGFRDLLGDNLVDAQRMSHCYKGEMDWDNIKKTGHRGYFSLYDRVPNISIDRTDIDSKLRNGHFDRVVLPIHHSCRNNQKVIEETVDYMSNFLSARSVIVVCGDEDPNAHMFLLNNHKCTFFKCEIQDILSDRVGRDIFPVSYCIPKENIVKEIPDKTMDFMPLIPCFLRRGDLRESTYSYTNESEYFEDYKKSYFGFTCKKGAWDLLRHYEMLACGCLPLFTDVERCPDNTLHTYPKDICVEIKKMKGIHLNIIGKNDFPNNTYIGTTMHKIGVEDNYIDHSVFSKDTYERLSISALEHTNKYLTTEYQAKYIIQTCNV